MTLRVLEIGQYAAGYAGRLFVRAGADVVRIEPAEALPAWASEAAMNAYLHAGKRRVVGAVDEWLARLLPVVDVVISEAPTADAQSALGFADWQNMTRVSITPFGLTGPKRNWQATPGVLLAMGGYTHLMGDADRAPLTLPGHYVEFQSGALAFAAAQAARINPADAWRETDISMLEVVMACSQFTTVRWHCAGEVRGRHGSDFWYVAPSDLFRCADGWVYVNIVPAFWDVFALLIDMPELLADARYETNDLRMQHRDTLYPRIAQAFAPMTRAQIEAAAAEFRVPLGVVRSLEDVLAEPHLAARGFWEDIDGLRSPGLPYRRQGDARPSLSVQKPETAHGG